MEWIPVTERLPENDDTVLIMWQDALGTVQAATAYYEAEDEEWYSNVVSALLYTDEILAWIPLPTMTLTSTPALVPDVANDTRDSLVEAVAAIVGPIQVAGVLEQEASLGRLYEQMKEK